MKTYTLICFFLALSLVLCPLVSVEKASQVISQEILDEPVSETEVTTEKTNSTVKVMSVSSNNITEMSLKEYLLGVVAGEMNASYHEEALKAQIVAAHTLLLYTKEHNTKDLKGADITDSYAMHQAFISPEKQKEKWKENYDTYREKILKCIDEVGNLTLQYDNEYICAVFHSISNGTTENAVDVWGGKYPYLVSVPSIGDKLSPAYQSQVTIHEKEFRETLQKEGVEFTGNAEKWVEKITNTETGMVKTIVICGKTFKGTEIRKLFDLRSSTFTCEYKDNEFVFTVNGYGHGAGMSQYGANYMAQQGFKYDEILKHYYKGVEIVEVGG
jgi:stage II sporulation protein D